MLRLFKLNLKKSLFNKRFIFLIILSTFSLFWCAYNYCYQYYDFNYNAPDIIGETGRQDIQKMVANNLNYFWVWFNSLSNFAMFIPIIACVSFSDSFVTDFKNNRLKYVYVRLQNKNKYIINKLVSGFIIGSLSIMIPLIIGYLICLILGNTTTEVPIIQNKMLKLFCSEDTPLLFINTYIVIQSLLGGAFCILGLGFSTFIRNKITPVLFPFIYYLINILFTEFFKLRFMSFQRLVNCYADRNMSMPGALSLILSVLIIGSILFYSGISRREYEQ